MDELRKLEQAIAYSGARSDIECFCQGDRHSGQYHGVWYDVTSVESDETKEMVANSVRYLELRNLLMRHPVDSNLVRPLDVKA